MSVLSVQVNLRVDWADVGSPSSLVEVCNPPSPPESSPWLIRVGNPQRNLGESKVRVDKHGAGPQTNVSGDEFLKNLHWFYPICPQFTKGPNDTEAIRYYGYLDLDLDSAAILKGEEPLFSDQPKQTFPSELVLKETLKNEIMNGNHSFESLCNKVPALARIWEKGRTCFHYIRTDKQIIACLHVFYRSERTAYSLV